jgi:predicted DNA-binding transcriptional regulator AlpA
MKITKEIKTGDSYLTAKEMRDRLRISPSTQCRLRNSGTGPPFVRVTAGTFLYPESMFNDWIRNKTISET